MFNLVDGILKFRQRGQFGKMSYVYIVLFILSVLTTIALFQEVDPSALVSLFLAALFLSLMFNIRGVDVDLKKRIIRPYKKVLWLKIRKKFDLNEFWSFSITQDSLFINTTRYSGHRSDSYYYYYLNLVCPVKNKKIILAESEDYYEIARAADDLSLQLNLDIKDEVPKYHREY